MKGYAVIAFYACIVLYVVFVATRLTTSRPDDDDPNASGFPELLLLIHAGAVVVGVVIPLIVYACQGGFAGMTIGQVLLALPDMAFDVDTYGLPARIVSYSFALAALYGLYKFVLWVHYRHTGIRE